MRVIGMISGTSFDAIEVAAADIEADGDAVVLRPLGALSVPYPEGVAGRLAAALPPAPTTAQEICELDTLTGRAFADAAREALEQVADGRADLVVSHGQTVFHWVEDGVARGTLQIGQPAWIAEATGLPVVADLRARDLAAGGQGAPLVSRFDELLLADRAEPCGALNLGGIANATVVAPGRPTIAFDTGPANALLDAVVADTTGGRDRYDAGGAGAAAGTVDDALLRHLLSEPYYAARPPKSTGKELFGLHHVRAALAAVGGELSTDDLLATLTLLTARTVSDALAPHGVREVVASGGGTANPTLMARLADELSREGPVRLTGVDELGVPSSAKEALAFALLGWLTAHDLPGNVPSCTGAAGPRVLGCLVPGPLGQRPAARAATVPARLRIVA